MSKPVTLKDALWCAVNTAESQPREVPELPSGWVARATQALESDDHAQMDAVAREIARAHNQYRAEFDVKGWLHDLREIQFQELMAQRAAATNSKS